MRGVAAIVVDDDELFLFVDTSYAADITIERILIVVIDGPDYFVAGVGPAEACRPGTCRRIKLLL